MPTTDEARLTSSLASLRLSVVASPAPSSPRRLLRTELLNGTFQSEITGVKEVVYRFLPVKYTEPQYALTTQDTSYLLESARPEPNTSRERPQGGATRSRTVCDKIPGLYRAYASRVTKAMMRILLTSTYDPYVVLVKHVCEMSTR